MRHTSHAHASTHTRARTRLQHEFVVGALAGQQVHQHGELCVCGDSVMAAGAT
jgi:hypothetical protein